MKYEITRGSKKDFDGAPEWATLLLKGRFAAKAWASSYSNGAKALTPGTTDKYIIDAIEDCTITAERRPITDPVVNQQLTTEWDGSGLLPSVGMKCLAKQNSQISADEFLVVDIQDGAVFGFWTSTGAATGLDVNRWVFLPIRSPEDVARDEAISSIASATGLLKYGGRDQVSKDIYDAIAAGKIPGIALSGK